MALYLVKHNFNFTVAYLKVKLSLCFTRYHAMKTCLLNLSPRHEGALGRGGLAPRIRNIGTRWRWMVSFPFRQHYPQGKIPQYALDRRLGGPQSRSEWGGKQKISPRGDNWTPVVQPVAWSP